MTHELSALFAAGVVYLILLFLVAYATDRKLIPERWVRHPAVYVLSLGVYATSWSYYGSVGFAAEQGYLFLTIYLGVTIAFLLSPLLLRPILKLTREYQFSSLADLLAFRYRSQFAGVLVALFTLLGALPYIALQIRAVTESLRVLSEEAAPQVLALSFCLILILFAILFGARHISPREKHRGLVMAIAFESLVKLVALLGIAVFALFGVFDGPGALQEWLSIRPEAVDALYQPVREGPWFTLLFLAFCAAFLLPRQFHMTFTENLDPRALTSASWGFPLFLLLLNLAIPPVLWAGQYLNLEMSADYYVLGITLHAGSAWLPVMAFIGGVSAASAMVIVTTLALSTMCLNHLVVPASFPDPHMNLYRSLLWGRRVLIALIILAGYGFYTLLEHNQGLVQLGLISFVAVAQFLPGVIGVLYWKRATRIGFITGLLGGIAVWVFTLLVPLLDASGIIRSDIDLAALEQRSGLGHWEFATFWSLAINGVLFALMSLITRQSEGEKAASRACCNEVFPPLSGVVSAGSPAQFRQALAGMIGEQAAQREVHQALDDLGMSSAESRPSELRRLRERIERNLSGLVGPQMAHMIVNLRLELDGRAKTALADSMRFVEEQLEASRLQLEGLTADLDALRRYHRQILRDLPLGVCATGADLRVTLWNPAMEHMSGVRARAALGNPVENLPSPWAQLLAGFARSQDAHIPHMKVELEDQMRWYNLHKATIPDPDSDADADASPRTGLVMLLEDLTDLETLEAELAHSDRLASIGRLAAGVAHEIGNPVTGIASLAQILRDEHADPEVRRTTKMILEQTQRITRIMRSLMSFSRSGGVEADFAPFRLHKAIDEALGLVRLAHKGKDVECLCDCPKKLEMVGDRQRLSQMLVNLCANACDASAAGDRVEVLAFARNGQVQIEVLDRGPGIPEEIQPLMFEPFFTTKPAGEGTGLGLSMVYKIVEEHRGSIEIDSAPDQGTRIVVRLPQNPSKLRRPQKTEVGLTRP
jgi:Na+/proline symporter/signal transduction histidine kinase